MSGELPAGTRLGAYTILEPLGRGGMGVVYKARDERLGRLVAIKVVARELLRDPRFSARFAREARAAAALVHPNVTTVFFVGEEGGFPFVVLELVPGGSLGQRLKERGALPPREVASLGAQVARGLQAIHRAGLVHRDVKPENVLLDAEGRAKITDFGLVGTSIEARLEATRALTGGGGDESRPTQLTQAGEIVGTLDYMAPEQIDDASRVDARADLYSLGATLYALLAGRAPFQGSGYALAKQQLTDRPAELSEVAPATPPRLERLVHRLLEKDPAARPESAALVASELEAIARGEGEATTGRGALLKVVLGVAAAAGLVLLGSLLGRGGEQPSPVSNAQPPATAANAKPATTASPKTTAPPARRSFPDETRTFVRSKEGKLRLAGVLGSYERKHARQVRAVQVTPDGREVLSASDDGTVAVWDVATGKELVRFTGHASPVLALAVSPDGKTALSGAEAGGVGLWEIASGRQLRAFPPHLAPPSPVTALAISPDGGTALAGTEDGVVHVLDLEGGQCRHTLEEARERGAAAAVGFQQAGKVAFASPRAGFPTFWDLGSLASKPPAAQPASILWARFSQDGERVLFGNDDGRLELMEAIAARRTATFRGEPKGVCVAAFARDGKRVLTGRRDGTIELWDPEKGEGPALVLTGHVEDVTSLAFFPDGKRAVSGGKDHTVRIWDLDAGREVGKPAAGHRGEVWSLAWFSDGKRAVSAGWDRTLRVWDVASGKESQVLADHLAGVHSVALSPDEKRAVSGDRSGVVRIWDTGSWRSQGYEIHKGVVRAAGFLSDGKAVFSCGEDGLATVWDPDTEKSRAGFHTNDREPWSWINAVAASPDGTRLLLDGCADLVYCEIASRRLVKRFPAHANHRTPHVEHVAFLAAGPFAGKALSSGRDGDLVVSDPEEGKVLLRLAGHVERIESFSVHEGKLVATAGWDATVRLFDLEAGKEIDCVDLSASGDHAIAASLSPDGRTLLAGTARGVVLRFDVAR